MGIGVVRGPVVRADDPDGSWPRRCRTPEHRCHADHRRRPAHQVSNPLPRHRCHSRHDPHRQRPHLRVRHAASRPTSTALRAAGSALRPDRAARPPGSPRSSSGPCSSASGRHGLRTCSPMSAPTAPRNRWSCRARDANEPVMALNVDVGDGRPIPKLVVGQFGAAVIRDLPDASVARPPGTVLGRPVRPGLDPHREPARPRRSRCRAGPSLVRSRRSRLCRSRLRRGRDGRYRAAPNADLRGDQ